MLQELTFCLKTFSTELTLLHSWTLSVRSSPVCNQNCVLVWKLLAHKSQFLPRRAFHLWTSITLHVVPLHALTNSFFKTLVVDGQITLHVVHLHALINLYQSRSFCNRIHKVSQNLLLFTSRPSVSKYHQEVFLSFYHKISQICYITIQEPIIPRILDVL